MNRTNNNDNAITTSQYFFLFIRIKFCIKYICTLCHLPFYTPHRWPWKLSKITKTLRIHGIRDSHNGPLPATKWVYICWVFRVGNSPVRFISGFKSGASAKLFGLLYTRSATRGISTNYKQRYILMVKCFEFSRDIWTNNF